MPAVFVDPGLSVFHFTAHPDQLGVNAAPTNQTHFLETSPHTLAGVYVHTHIQQTDRDYSGGDTVRGVKSGFYAWNDVDNNDPAWNPIAICSIGFQSINLQGKTGPSYGTLINYVGECLISNVPSPHGNEYSIFYATIVAGSTANVISGGNYWFFDHAFHGPINQPGRMVGYSLVFCNHYNGGPQFGHSAAMSVQNTPQIGGQHNGFDGSPNYPVDIGFHISGNATGSGTGDGFTNAFQVGGYGPVWIDPTLPSPVNSYGGDLGQVARGYVVKAKNAGGPVSRLGAFVSEGTGEGGGLVLGLDTNDANRVSLYRPSPNALTVNGNLSHTSAGLLTRAGGIIYEACSAGTALASSAAAASLLAGVATSIGSLTIPANSLAVGKIIRPYFWGTNQNAGTVTMTFSLWLGATQVWSVTSASLAATTAPMLWCLNANYVGSGLQVQAIGASGKVIGVIFGVVGSAASISNIVGGTNTAGTASQFLAPVAVTVDTTAALAFDVRAQWSVAAAGNTIQLLGGHVSIDG